MQVKTNSMKNRGLSLGLTLGAALSLTLQLSPQVARADSGLSDGFVITHDPGAERKAFQHAQKEQAKALKQHQRFESNYILDKRTRHKLQKEENRNLKLQQQMQKKWLREHQWSEQH